MVRTFVQAICAAAILTGFVVGPAVVFAGATRLTREPTMLNERMPCGMTGLECTGAEMIAARRK
ncbi:hypothetical protein [Amorphus orientalis]|uniref:Uncharacterized protein n=1 Tax=Amorphus orientalis TaxID=649198 RepID=A0AAE3VQS5_9HYPH|nr:hypothetical protein [Amorphus orientalis]MDQ0316448.1 hypothetical protein [Amorphus orientalis]